MDVSIYKKILKEKRMTYEDLAQKTGLSLGCIKRIMAGIARYPRIDSIEAIENALGISSTITPEGETASEPLLTTEEKELLSLFRQLSPYLQGLTLDTVRGWAGSPAGSKSNLQKKG